MDLVKVQAAPNKCILIGRIKRVQRQSVSPPKFTLELAVLDSEDVEGMPNFGKQRVGSIVSAFTPENASQLKTDTTIRCDAEYRGGPTGGMFRLTNITKSNQP